MTLPAEPPHHISTHTLALTSLALVAFASNSILCRLALAPGLIDPAGFTLVRLVSGAAILVALVAFRDRRVTWIAPHWRTIVALVAYAIPFSFAYVRIPIGAGALVLFAAVQVTMIGADIIRGRMHRFEWVGLLCALGGLVLLTMPGVSDVDPAGAGMMAAAGVAWGIYSLAGRNSMDSLRETAGNFLFGSVLAIPLIAAPFEAPSTIDGIGFAIASGTLASGAGYAVWYKALRGLTATQAGIVQLLAPVIAAAGGAIIMDEQITLRLGGSGVLILGGVSLALITPRVKSKG